MTSKIKNSLISLFTLFCAIIFIYLTGCCSKGGGSGFVVGNVGSDRQAEPIYFDAKVNDDGSINRTIAPSGRFSLYATENTLHKDVVVHVVESESLGKESNIYSVGKYIYAIKADREEKNETGINIGTNAKRDVKMQTNPIILTFSNDERLIGAENYYIGIKEISDNDWQYVNVYSSTNPQINSNGPAGSFEYKLYKDNVQVALFADFNKNAPDTPRVLSMTASMPHNIIETFEGRYNEDAVIKLNFIGDNLSALRADDFKIRLLYANADSKQVNIRIDGKTANFVSGTSTNQYEAFGELYAHYFEFVPSSASYTALISPELSFTLNLKGFPVEDFANDFIVEVYNNSKNLVAFNYTTRLHFDTKETDSEEPEPQPGPGPEPVIQPSNLAFVIASNPTNIIDVGNNLYFLKPTFSINASPSFDFSDEEKATIASAVTVIGADNSILTKAWINGSLVVSFNRNLNSNTEYTLRMDAVNNLERLIVEPFEPIVFKTTNDYYIALSPDTDNMFDRDNSLYHCQPTFTITTNIVLNDDDKAKIASALKVDGVEVNNITKRWENDSLILSFNQNLAQNREFTVSISEMPEIEGKSFTTFQPFVFRTMGTLNFALTADNNNIYATQAPLYHCKPNFTITPSISLNEEIRAKIANAINISNVENNQITKNWDNDGKLTIGFSQNIAPATDYTLSMSSVNDIKGVTVIPFDSLNFTTIATLAITLTPNADNVFDFTNNQYHCRPEFTISPSFTLNDSEKAIIANAISVSGVNENIINKQWNGNNLTLDFTQNIATSTAYTISMSTVDSINGVKVANFDSLNFTTIPDLIVSIAATTDSIVKESNGSTNLNVNGKNYLYCQSPQHEVSVNIPLNDTNKAKIKDAISGEGAISTLLTKSAWNGNKITLNINSTLTASTTYKILTSDITDIKGVNVKTTPTYSFTTFFHLGKGTETDPFTIYTPAQLACLNYYPTQAYFYKQMDDLNLSSYTNWKPIGTYAEGFEFKGKFNGNNKTISNLVTNFPDTDCIGLFGYSHSAVFSNINLENFTVSGNELVGCAIGFAEESSITSCNITNSFASGSNYIGSCIGSSHNNNVTEVTCDTVTVNGSSHVGGGFGEVSDSTFTTCNITNSIATGDYSIGGLFGVVGNSTVTTCNIINSIASAPSDYAGGCIAYLYGNNNNISEITCDEVRVYGREYVGVVLGNVEGEGHIINTCTVTNSAAFGTGQEIGGVIGLITRSTITNCNVSNTIASGGAVVGGAFGYIGNSTVTTCNVTNTIATGSSSIGGCIGVVYNSSNISGVNCNEATVNGNNNIGGAFGSIKNSTITSCNITNSNVSGTFESAGGCIATADNSNISSVICNDIRVNGYFAVGGLVGSLKNNSTITKSLIKATNIKGKSSRIAGLVGSLASSTMDSCYITGSGIEVTNNYEDNGGLVGYNKGDISNCCMYNSTFTGYSDYGAIVGENDSGRNSIIKDCFVSQNHNILINTNNNNEPINCYYNVNNLGTFSGKTWSAGAWSNYDTTSFPPKLNEVTEP